MSRVGNNPVTIPSGVNVEVKDNTVVVRGGKGELTAAIVPFANVSVKDNQVTFTRKNDEKHARAQHGLMRALVQNMVTGVSEGFEKKLEVNGVGFKVNVSGKTLKLSLGYSHDIEYTVPADIDVSVEQNVITLKGADKQLVGHTAAEIRKLRKPEPYKGKGIKYVDEYIVRKAGKTAAGGGE